MKSLLMRKHVQLQNIFIEEKEEADSRYAIYLLQDFRSTVFTHSSRHLWPLHSMQFIPTRQWNEWRREFIRLMYSPLFCWIHQMRV